MRNDWGGIIHSTSTHSTSKKDFDSLHCDTQWEIIHWSGVPLKMTVVIKMFSNQFQCSVILNGNLTDWLYTRDLSSPYFSRLLLMEPCERPMVSLDYSDDLSILYTNPTFFQKKTASSKSQAMHINSAAHATITVDGKSPQGGLCMQQNISLKLQVITPPQTKAFQTNCKSKQYSLKPQIWQQCMWAVKNDKETINAFHNYCLQKVCLLARWEFH